MKKTYNRIFCWNLLFLKTNEKDAPDTFDVELYLLHSVNRKIGFCWEGVQLRRKTFAHTSNFVGKQGHPFLVGIVISLNFLRVCIMLAREYTKDMPRGREKIREICCFLHKSNIQHIKRCI